MRDNRLVRNVPVLLWWIAILVALLGFTPLVFVLGLILFAATPFKSWLLTVSDERPIPLSGLDKFVALGNMTALSTVKAMMYGKGLPKSTERKMLDKSKEVLS